MKKPPTWQPLHYEHVGAIDLPIVEYDGTQWVPLGLLAKSLKVDVKRLLRPCQAAALLPHTRLMYVATGQTGEAWQPAVARLSLSMLATRLRPGTDNTLLKFVHNIETISGLVVHDQLQARARSVLAQVQRREQKLRERQERRAQFVKAYEVAAKSGKPAARRQWQSSTGKSAAMLDMFFTGRYATHAAREARTEITQRFGEFAPEKSKRGRRPLLTADIIKSIQTVLDIGRVSVDDIARVYKVSAATVEDIRRGFYRTAEAASAANAARRTKGTPQC